MKLIFLNKPQHTGLVSNSSADDLTLNAQHAKELFVKLIDELIKGIDTSFSYSDFLTEPQVFEKNVVVEYVCKKYYGCNLKDLPNNVPKYKDAKLKDLPKMILDELPKTLFMNKIDEILSVLNSSWTCGEYLTEPKVLGKDMEIDEICDPIYGIPIDEIPEFDYDFEKESDKLIIEKHCLHGESLYDLLHNKSIDKDLFYELRDESMKLRCEIEEKRFEEYLALHADIIDKKLKGAFYIESIGENIPDTIQQLLIDVGFYHRHIG